MNKKSLIQTFLVLSALASLTALVALLLIPADVKNAALGGFSLARLGLAAALLLPAFVFGWLGFRALRDRTRLNAWDRRLAAWLDDSRRLGLALLAGLGAALAGGAALRWMATAPALSLYKAYLVRLAPLLGLITFLGVAGLLFVLLYGWDLAAMRAGRNHLGSEMAAFARSRGGHALAILLVNLLISGGLLYGTEAILRRSDHCVLVRKDMPFDTNDYNISPECYSGRDVPDRDQGVYTWGHLVVNNSLGFREDEIEIPKPANVCRIMVLGDSFTWGAGLAVDERYTDLTEEQLNQAFPDQTFELLNFGVPGGPTTLERDILAEYGDEVSPDLIVVGFYHNDPEPPPVPDQQAAESQPSAIDTLAGFLERIHLPFIARKLRATGNHFATRVGISEPWWVQFDRNYDPNSPAWLAFEGALQDIYDQNQAMGNPPPVFAVLANVVMTPEFLASKEVQTIKKWQDQAEAAAQQIGFVTINYDDLIRAEVAPEEMPVNPLDTHPSAKTNQVFAEGLFNTLSGLYQSGELCGQ